MSAGATGSTGCLACGGHDLRPVADLGELPALVGALWSDRETARTARRGRLSLVACGRCGHVANAAFDPGLMHYDGGYDNSLHFSPAFARYANELAMRLVDTYDIRGKHVVEIGSGRGDFLAAICQAGRNTGTGYDPTHRPDQEIPGVSFVADYYRPEDAAGAAYDLLVCRHVLEHLDDPAALLRALRKAALSGNEVLYLEVPAAEFNFGPDGLWDCIYPHVSYFSATSLRCLLERCGFAVLSLTPSFNRQFLSAEVRPVPAAAAPADLVDPAAVARHLDRLSQFGDRWSRTVERWRRALADAPAEDAGLVALWGAGAKGVTFLNAVNGAARLAVVDRNPRKWGRYLPGTGHRVDSPDTLAAAAVSTVLITNEAYRSEITHELTELGVSATVVAV